MKFVSSCNFCEIYSKTKTIERPAGVVLSHRVPAAVTRLLMFFIFLPLFLGTNGEEKLNTNLFFWVISSIKNFELNEHTLRKLRFNLDNAPLPGKLYDFDYDENSSNFDTCKLKNIISMIYTYHSFKSSPPPGSRGTKRQIT